MNKIFKGVLVVLGMMMFGSCQKDDTMAPIPLVPFAEQYPVDLAAIDKFLDEYYLIVDDATADVSFKKIQTLGDSLPIRTQTDYPLEHKMVSSNGVDYKVYFLNISKKRGQSYDPSYYGENENPTKVDSVFVSYKGTLMDNSMFDQATNPLWFPLDGVVQGWGEIIPKFKTGHYNTLPTDGTIDFYDFGAGVMFLPSGLGYYNISRGLIPGYAPLIFSFKLLELNYVDHDYDGIDSKDEDLNGNGDYTDDDTDGDGRQNYKDKDDDGDGVLTKYEVVGDCDSDGILNYLDKDCKDKI